MTENARTDRPVIFKLGG